MKIKIDKNEYWIKEDVILQSILNQMNEKEKWAYIIDNKLLHREDGPAVIDLYGTKSWYLNGLCHRLDEPAILYYDGSKAWYLNGLCHRLDGPAVIHPNGTKSWWLNGLRHRIDGPAFIFSDGNKAFYLNDIRVDEEIYKKIENSSKEELLMYAVIPKYKNYISLIDYRLGII